MIFLLHFVHFYSVTSCNASHNHWIENFVLQCFWLSFQRHLWINTQSEETACIVPKALSLLMMKVKLKILPKHVFFYLNNLMKTTHEDNYFLWKYLEPTLCLMSEGKGLFPPPGATNWAEQVMSFTFTKISENLYPVRCSIRMRQLNKTCVFWLPLLM